MKRGDPSHVYSLFARWQEMATTKLILFRHMHATYVCDALAKKYSVLWLWLQVVQPLANVHETKWTPHVKRPSDVAQSCNSSDIMHQYARFLHVLLWNDWMNAFWRSWSTASERIRLVFYTYLKAESEASRSSGEDVHGSTIKI